MKRLFIFTTYMYFALFIVQLVFLSERILWIALGFLCWLVSGVCYVPARCLDFMFNQINKVYDVMCQLSHKAYLKRMNASALAFKTIKKFSESNNKCYLDKQGARCYKRQSVRIKASRTHK